MSSLKLSQFITPKKSTLPKPSWIRKTNMKYCKTSSNCRMRLTSWGGKSLTLKSSEKEKTRIWLWWHNTWKESSVSICLIKMKAQVSTPYWQAIPALKIWKHQNKQMNWSRLKTERMRKYRAKYKHTNHVKANQLSERKAKTWLEPNRYKKCQTQSKAYHQNRFKRKEYKKSQLCLQNFRLIPKVQPKTWW